MRILQPILDQSLDREITQQLGRWVAVAEHRVIAVGSSAKEVWEAAKAQGHPDALILRGPLHEHEEELVYIFPAFP